jgi:hypothetical protein
MTLPLEMVADGDRRPDDGRMKNDDGLVEARCFERAAHRLAAVPRRIASR